MASKSTNVGSFNGKSLFATPTGIKVGAKGLVEEAGAILQRIAFTHGKGEARKVRKALRSAGFKSHAAAPCVHRLLKIAA